MYTTDTIAAIATAMSNSGIGIVRISGSEAFAVADRVFREAGKPETGLKDAQSHTITTDISTMGMNWWTRCF